MPGGELSNQGNANTELFSEIVQRMGWIQRGPQNENIECSKCKPNKSGSHRKHGVDTLFTFMCPYRGVTRGIVVEGKRYKMSSVSADMLKKWIVNSLMVTQHLEHSLHLFRKERDLPSDTFIDTGVIVWDCHEKWNTKIGLDMISKVKFFSSSVPTSSILLLHKDHLNKIATIDVFRQRHNQFEFLYNPESVAVWSQVLTPELMMSDMLAVRYRKEDKKPWEHGIMFLGPLGARQLKFVIPYLAYAQLTSHSKVTVHFPCKQSELPAHKAALESAMADIPGSTLELTCARIPTSTFDS